MKTSSIVVIVCLMFAVRGFALGGAPPLLSQPRPFILAPAPSNCGAIHVTEAGDVWVSDREASIVARYSREGRLLQKVGTPGEARGQLHAPGSLCVSRDVLAVECENKKVVLFGASDGRLVDEIPFRLLHGTYSLNPGMGLALHNQRLLYLGAGFSGSPPPIASDARVLTCVSANMAGGDIRSLIEEMVPAAKRAALILFGRGFCADMGGGDLVVCHSLPGTVRRLDAQGRVKCSGDALALDLPALPISAIVDDDGQAKALYTTPHLEGLFRSGDFLGAVLQHPSQDRSTASFGWTKTCAWPVRRTSIFPMPSASGTSCWA